MVNPILKTDPLYNTFARYETSPLSLFNKDAKPVAIDKDIASYWEEYFCGADVVILIGDMWVDDVLSIQYTMSNNKSPVYGYMSEDFDAVAKGNRIVQGQLVIAFREVDYLYKILKNYRKKLGGDVNLKDKFKVYGDERGLSGQSFRSAFDQTEYVDRFRYQPDTGYGGWVERAGFDIILVFGDPTEELRGGTVEVINNVHIVSRSLSCDPSGEPIAEIYGFFGRNLNQDRPQFNYVINKEPIKFPTSKVNLPSTPMTEDELNKLRYDKRNIEQMDILSA